MTTISSQIYLASFSAAAFDQGLEESCVANAVCQAIRLESNEYHQDTGQLARNQIYHDYMVATHETADKGAALIAMLSIAEGTGIVTQANAIPYNQSTLFQSQTTATGDKVTGFTDFSNWLAYKNGDPAQGNLPYDTTTFSTSAAAIQTQIRTVVDTQLMHGKSVIIAAQVPDWWVSDSSPLSAQIDETNITGYGSHAFIIVGRDDNLKGGSYIVENSWGAAWGDHGYVAIPYNMIDAGIIPSAIAVIDGFKGTDTTWTTQRGDISELYVSILGRAADHAGLEFWASQEKSGGSLSQIANALCTSSEGGQIYSSLSNSDYVNKLYTNMTGHAASASTITTWVAQMSQGTTRGDVGLNMMNSLLNATGADHDALVNRSTVSENYALTYQMTGTHDQEVGALVGVTADANTVQIALTGIQHAMGWMDASATTYGFHVA